MSLNVWLPRGNLRQRTRERELASSRSRRDVLHAGPSLRTMHRPPWSVLDWTEYYLRAICHHPRCRRGHAYGDVRGPRRRWLCVAHAFAFATAYAWPTVQSDVGRGLGHVRFAERSPVASYGPRGSSRRWPTFAPQSLQEFRRCCWRTTGCWYSTERPSWRSRLAESWKSRASGTQLQRSRRLRRDPKELREAALQRAMLFEQHGTAHA